MPARLAKVVDGWTCRHVAWPHRKVYTAPSMVEQKVEKIDRKTTWVAPDEQVFNSSPAWSTIVDRDEESWEQPGAVAVWPK